MTVMMAVMEMKIMKIEFLMNSFVHIDNDIDNNSNDNSDNNVNNFEIHDDDDSEKCTIYGQLLDTYVSTDPIDRNQET